MSQATAQMGTIVVLSIIYWRLPLLDRFCSLVIQIYFEKLPLKTPQGQIAFKLTLRDVKTFQITSNNIKKFLSFADVEDRVRMCLHHGGEENV